MAIMCPQKPEDFTKNSKEDIMFSALEKLPDSYYVFHSFSIVDVVDGVILESETDFVIFHPLKGIICLEAKAGNVKCKDGIWKYGSGRYMAHDGPFNQAAINKWKLKKYIEDSGLGYIIPKCKLLHAVWFPSISRSKFDDVVLPSNSDLRLLLDKESFDHLEEDINKIFDIQLSNNIETNLGNNDINALLDKALAPSFNVISIPEIDLEHKRQVFKIMLKEQSALLNYLEEQNNAIINGMAGTGKTVMAIEKAKRHACLGEKVLFLCYNVYLKEHLQALYNQENIDFYTIDGLACKLCDTKTPNYNALKDTLENMYFEDSFPYKHVVIDEGQDFGRSEMVETDIVNLLKMNTVDDNKQGSFYLFYDRNQMVQSATVPEYINEVECKLTLYRNCRNTENIAITSLRLLGTDKKPKLFEGAIFGETPEFYICDSITKTVNTINNIIEKNLQLGYDNIQLLTCKTESTSIISQECSTGIYMYNGKKIPFTTCRKYKGLEADVIIMVDMDKAMLEDEQSQIMYVGSSRARYKLSLIATITRDDCEDIICKKGLNRGRKVEKTLATLYNSKFRE